MVSRVYVAEIEDFAMFAVHLQKSNGDWDNRLKLGLEDNSSEQLQQTKDDSKGNYYFRLYALTR